MGLSAYGARYTSYCQYRSRKRGKSNDAHIRKVSTEAGKWVRVMTPAAGRHFYSLLPWQVRYKI